MTRSFLELVPANANLEGQSSMKSGWHGPRWLGMESAFRNSCFVLGLTIERFEIEKHLISEDARFEVVGRGHDIVRFGEWFEKVVDVGDYRCNVKAKQGKETTP